MISEPDKKLSTAKKNLKKKKPKVLLPYISRAETKRLKLVDEKISKFLQTQDKMKSNRYQKNLHM